MDKIALTLKFWLLFVIVPSLRASINFSRIGGKLMDIIFGVAVAIVLVIGLGQSGTIPDFGANMTTFAFFTLFTVLGRFLWNILYIPANVFHEQGGFIKNPFDITPNPSDTNFAAPIEKWVWLIVRNKSKTDNIEHCQLQLDEVLDLASGKRIAFEPLKLKWSQRELNNKQSVEEPLSVQYGGERWCDVAVASAVKRTASFTTTFAMWSNHTTIMPGHYRLKISVLGTWKNHPLCYSYLVHLNYQLDKDLLIERVEATGRCDSR